MGFWGGLLGGKIVASCPKCRKRVYFPGCANCNNKTLQWNEDQQLWVCPNCSMGYHSCTCNHCGCTVFAKLFETKVLG